MDTIEDVVVHVSELEGFTPVHEAFTSFVINNYVTMPIGTMLFKEVSAPFGKTEAKYLMQIQDLDEQELLEFWIIYKDDMPMAIAQRRFKDGEMQWGSIGFTQYQMMPYHLDCVKGFIMQLPEL